VSDANAWENIDESARTEGLIDPVSLGVWMDAQGLPGRGEPMETTFVSGGSSNEIFEIRRGEHRLALRRPPRVVPEGRNATMLREYRVLEALNGTDVPHPEAFAACDDTSVIGAAFYLMGFVDGWSPMSYGRTWPAPFDTDVDGIARLARVDWRQAGLEGFGKPDGFLERQVDRWLAHLERNGCRDLPGTDVTAAWLREHIPATYEPGIIHGDYQFANVMYRHGAPATLAAIVDWEMTTIGDPLLDLGWVTNGWPREDEDPSQTGYVDMVGMPPKEALLAHYSEVSGRSTADIDYYEILARFKLAIVLEAQYARFQRGGADNPKIEAFGPITIDLMDKAAEHTTRARVG
jgi:aminoglycoside phosphotransferase (APT) family kinase protein